MNKEEIKAVLEKQLQLLSEHSKDSVNRMGGELGNDTSAIMIIVDKLLQLQAEEETAKRRAEFFRQEQRIGRQHRIAMWIGLAALVIGVASVVICLC